jgi:hypothetical protein
MICLPTWALSAEPVPADPAPTVEVDMRLVVGSRSEGEVPAHLERLARELESAGFRSFEELAHRTATVTSGKPISFGTGSGREMHVALTSLTEAGATLRITLEREGRVAVTFGVGPVELGRTVLVGGPKSSGGQRTFMPVTVRPVAD